MGTARVPGWVWAVLVGAHLLGLGWALSKGHWDFPDSGRYVQAAENLRVHGQLYARPWPKAAPHGQVVQELTIRPVGYPLVIWALGATGRIPVALLVVQNLLSLLNLGLVLRFWVWMARPNPRDWVWAVAGILTFPAQLIYSSTVMSETMLQTAVLVMAGAGLLFIKTHSKRALAGVAGAVVLALLLKPVFYPLAMAIAGVGIVLAVRQRRLLLGLIGLGPLVIVGLYMGWNARRTGYFHFSSITEINLLQYNAAGVMRQVAGPAAEERWVDAVLQAANAQPDFSARQQVIRARASAVLWAHPVVYARQQVQGMAALVLDPGRFDISQFLGLAPPSGGGFLAQVRAGTMWQAVGRLPLALLGWLGVVLLANATRLVLAWRGFRRLRNREPMLRYGRWIAVALVFYIAVLTGPLGAARFLVPVWPLLLALALAGLRAGKTPLASETTQGCGLLNVLLGRIE